MVRWSLIIVLAVFQEPQLRSYRVSRESPGKHFMIDRSLILNILGVFSLACLKVLLSNVVHSGRFTAYRVVRSASFLASGVLDEYNLSHRWSVAVCACYLRSRITKCILWAVHRTSALPYVASCVSRGALHGCWTALVYFSSRRTFKYITSFMRLFVYLWNDLNDPVCDDVGLVGFKSRANALLLA